MKKITNILIFMLGAIAFTNCGGESNDSNANNTTDSTAIQNDTVTIDQTVFYNPPSPIETFTLLKMYGGKFDKSILNPTTNISKYVSNGAKAINLGIYSADLSLCMMYKLNQETNTYIKNVSELTNQLGIDGSYGQEVFKRLKANENNLDSLNEIIAEATVNTDLYLKENQRNNVTVLIAAGAWLESAHIIASAANKTQNADLISLTADQKITIKPILKLLEQNSSDADASKMATDLKEIASLLDAAETKVTEASASATKDAMVVGNNSTNTLTKEQLKTILEKIQTLRNKLTN